VLCDCFVFFSLFEKRGELVILTHHYALCLLLNIMTVQEGIFGLIIKRYRNYIQLVNVTITMVVVTLF